MGGATLDEPIKEGEPAKINGSALVVSADTHEDVMALIKSDIYFKEGVWDQDKVSSLSADSRAVEMRPASNGVGLARKSRIVADTALQIQIFPFKSAVRTAL